MAAAIFEATAAEVVPVAKVPVVALLQPLLPLEPGVTPLQLKLLAFPPSVRDALLPSVVPLTVTAPPTAVALAPTDGYEALQLLMAAARYAAKVAGGVLAAK